MGVLDKLKHEQPGASDPILTRPVAEDRVPWCKKPNLRSLYLLLFPACMGIELTSGFDSQMINALQIVPSWKECKTSLTKEAFRLLLGDKPIQAEQIHLTFVPRLRQSSGKPQGHHSCRVLPRCDSLATARPLGK